MTAPLYHMLHAFMVVFSVLAGLVMVGMVWAVLTHTRPCQPTLTKDDMIKLMPLWCGKDGCQ